MPGFSQSTGRSRDHIDSRRHGSEHSSERSSVSARSSPSTAHNQLPSRSHATSRRDELDSIQRLADLLSEKVSLTLQRNKAVETVDHWERKKQHTHDRQDFHSGRELILETLRRANHDVTKYNNRISAVDGKLASSFSAALEQAGQPRQPERRGSQSERTSRDTSPNQDDRKKYQDLLDRVAALEESNKAKAAPEDTVMTGTNSTESQHEDEIKELQAQNKRLEERINELDGKLSAASDAAKLSQEATAELVRSNEDLEAKMAKMEERLQKMDRVLSKQGLVDAPGSLIETIETQRAETAALQEAHKGQSETIAALQQRLGSLPEQLEGLRTDVANEVKAMRNQFVEKAAVEDQLRALDLGTNGRFEAFESKLPSEEVITQALSEIERFKQHIKECADAANERQERQKKLEEDEKSQQAMESTHSDVTLSLLSSEIDLVKAHISKLMSHPPGAQNEPIQTAMRAFIAPIMSGLQTKLNGMSTKFGSMLDKETDERERLVGEVNKMQDTLATISKDVAVTKSSSGQISEIHALVQNHAKELASQKENITAVCTKVDATKEETTSTIETLQHQMLCLDQWQNNFSTDKLYKNIVRHIDETMPKGVQHQMRNISSRLEAVERQSLMEDEPFKRRKVSAGG
ncbi:hypothetical protein B0I35DRAFT_428704 [Stachybotrys elegans]|uniref:Uncharacterized protein n=1 Tax=Stachybotrys elegans TaxID=80388 RepID=A0A8K0SUG8_9HYPO|nr:hypothetical protein B0I35DRAFT_428704 [Stachybotrys elegans]